MPKRLYNPEVELAKGAKFEAATYDKTQTIKVLVAGARLKIFFAQI